MAASASYSATVHSDANGRNGPSGHLSNSDNRLERMMAGTVHSPEKTLDAAHHFAMVWRLSDHTARNAPTRRA
jgi:hypothetical protein